LIGCLPWDWYRCLQDGQQHCKNRQGFQHGETVSDGALWRI
jgi:hypothetical protein